MLEGDKQSRKVPGAKKLDGAAAERKGEGDPRFPSSRFCVAMGLCSLRGSWTLARGGVACASKCAVMRRWDAGRHVSTTWI